ncbi:MAG: hypothetical protein DA408_00270 [Bacteroidetes bacterium]|nr:MAG: hypothetical protein C7N36_09000 [Bacteroidota bacterium]PTM15089.1 MAG: hypothetical protein DA408_00270 [Bacteroidota bacterium]
MKNAPAVIYLLTLSLYPFYSYVVRYGTGTVPDYVFGFLGMLLLAHSFYRIYTSGKNLRIPYYLVLLGCFAAYTLVSNILVSDNVTPIEVVKYFYSNPFILSFVAFLWIENTHFPAKWIHISVNILGVTLVIAAITSILQISNPSFFLNMEDFKAGLSFDRLSQYYAEHPKESTDAVSRFLAGYRLSIYSWITTSSIGIDAIAIFSILWGLPHTSGLKKGIWLIAAGLLSFLSSARWIMLGFLIVAAQNTFTQRNKLLNALKYALMATVLIVGLATTANLLGVNVQQFVKNRLFDHSASTRLFAFEVFFKVFPKQPIFGTGGIDTPAMERLLMGRSSQIHVGYLKLFYYYGLVGGIMYLAFLFSFLMQLWKKARQSQYWGSFFALLAFAIANFTIVQWSPFYHGLLLALIFSNHFYPAATQEILTTNSADTATEQPIVEVPMFPQPVA